LVKDETNVYKLKYTGKTKEFKIFGDTSARNQDLVAGQAREIIRKIQQARKEANCKLDQLVTVKLPSWPKEFEVEIKHQTLAKRLAKAEKLEIVK